VLSLVGVPPEEIDADYSLSAVQLRPLYKLLIRDAVDLDDHARLHRENVSEPGAMLQALENLNTRDYLLAGGATEEELAMVEARLLH
jgi:hypothetical protein